MSDRDVQTPCRPDRFTGRVFTDEAFDRPLCRCCGRYLGRATIAHDAGDMDGYCRRCERGHPEPLTVGRPRLFSCSMALCYFDPAKGYNRPDTSPPDTRPEVLWFKTIEDYAEHIRSVHRLSPHAAPQPWVYELRYVDSVRMTNEYLGRRRAWVRVQR